MKEHQYAGLLKRIGGMLMAIGLAFALASYLAQSTLNTPQFVAGEGASSVLLAPQNFVVTCCDPPFVSPKEVIYIGASPLSSSLTLYVMKTNQSTFDSWVSARSSVSFYGQGSLANASLFLSYLSAHDSELISKSNVPAGGSYQTNFFPRDVEPLMVVLLNSGNENTTVQYFISQNAIQISPALGYLATAGLILVGAIVFGSGHAFQRRRKKMDANS